MIQEHLFGTQFEDDIEGVITLVTRVAREECENDTCLVAGDLDDCVLSAVTQFSDSRIKAFVPLLALRQVRCCIRAGSCDCGRC